MPYITDANGNLVFVPEEPRQPGAVGRAIQGEGLAGQAVQSAARLAGPAGAGLLTTARGVEEALRAPAVATPPQPGTVGLTPEQATPLIQADTANLRAFNEATTQQFAAADARLGAQQQSNPVQQPQAAGGGFLQPAQRGVFNQYNTDVATLPQPQTAGINFGFGVNGAPTARETLDRFALQDQQARARQDERLAQATQAAQLSELRDLRNDPVAYRQALRELEITSPQLAAQQAGLGAQTQANIEAASRQGVAGTQAEAALQQEQIANLGRAQAAEITGGLGVQAALARAQGALAQTQLEAQSPEAQKAAVEAGLLGLRYDAALRGIASGELGTSRDVAAVTRAGQESQERAPISPITGAPLSQEEVALEQQLALARLRRQQAQQQ